MQGSRDVTMLHHRSDGLSDWWGGGGAGSCCTSFPMPLCTSGPLTCYIVPSTHRQVTLPEQPVALLGGETVSGKTFHPQICFQTYPWYHTTKTCKERIQNVQLGSENQIHRISSQLSGHFCLHSTHDLVMTLLRGPRFIYSWVLSFVHLHS